MRKPVGEAIQRKMNIVTDTNVLVAALRSRRGASHEVLQKVRCREGLTLHLSTPVVLEYEEVLLREIVPAYGTKESVEAFIDEIVAISVRHSRILPRRPLAADPDDDGLAELALTADVDALVTFNKSHFLELPALGIDLLTPGQLLQDLQL